MVDSYIFIIYGIISRVNIPFPMEIVIVTYHSYPFVEATHGLETTGDPWHKFQRWPVSTSVGSLGRGRLPG